MNNFCKNTAKFISLTIILAGMSLFLKNLLINNYNGADFALLSIEHIKNYGAAFSIFQYHTPFLIIISSIILVFTLFYILRNINILKGFQIFFLSMLTAGILCNLIERFRDGFVTDYIKLNFISFPIFNISDLFICTSAFVLICNILFNSDNKNDDNSKN